MAYVSDKAVMLGVIISFGKTAGKINVTSTIDKEIKSNLSDAHCNDIPNRNSATLFLSCNLENLK